MPKLLRARPPTDSAEERLLRKLAASKRAPAEQVLRARTIAESWDGADTATIAASLGCHPQTVRDRISRFNADGLDAIVAASGGRRPRLTEPQRRELVAMVERLTHGQQPEYDLGVAAPSRDDPILVRRPSSVTLDMLVTAARRRGIEVRRSQLRRILLAAGLRWHPTYSWGPGDVSSRKRA
jgi:transposase